MDRDRVEAFREWLDEPKNVGSVITYYRGFLGVQRATYIRVAGTDEISEIAIPNGDVDILGTLAMEAYEAGKVHLFQRKVHDNEYEYIAMKRYNIGRNW